MVIASNKSFIISRNAVSFEMPFSQILVVFRMVTNTIFPYWSLFSLPWVYWAWFPCCSVICRSLYPPFAFALNQMLSGLIISAICLFTRFHRSWNFHRDHPHSPTDLATSWELTAPLCTVFPLSSVGSKPAMFLIDQWILTGVNLPVSRLYLVVSIPLGIPMFLVCCLLGPIASTQYSLSCHFGCLLYSLASELPKFLKILIEHTAKHVSWRN